MRWHAATLLSFLVFLASGPVDAANQNGQRHGWWLSDEVRAHVELTDDQSARLDRIYKRALPKLRDSMRRLNAEEHTLSQLVADMGVEEIDVTRQVDRVEAVRSELSKTRLLMVFRMYRVLEPDQRDALDQWRNRDSSSQHSDRRRSRQR